VRRSIPNSNCKMHIADADTRKQISLERLLAGGVTMISDLALAGGAPDRTTWTIRGVTGH